MLYEYMLFMSVIDEGSMVFVKMLKGSVCVLCVVFGSGIVKVGIFDINWCVM